MQLGVRKLLDRSFSLLGIASILLVAVSLVILLAPIAVRGLDAFVFEATIERRKMFLGEFGRGDRAAIEAEAAKADQARQPVYDMVATFEREMDVDNHSELDIQRLFKEQLANPGPRHSRGDESFAKQLFREEIAKLDYDQDDEDEVFEVIFDAKAKVKKRMAAYALPLKELKQSLRALLGPFPGEEFVVLHRKYGQTRWDRAQVKLEEVLTTIEYEYPEPDALGRQGYGTPVQVPRMRAFEGTPLEALFPYIETHGEEMFLPRRVFYWRFLFDEAKDEHRFGGVWAELLGTLYLAVGAMAFAVPMGVIAAIYLVEYSREGRLVSILRTFISTLAGVPSVVFGLFGLAFFVSYMRMPKSVLAGSLTLGLLVLPMVIRASEEAIRAVPHAYKEAALSLGASRWRTVLTVILPAALPGILTGIVISMGRAAGETAPIIFVAAASFGDPLNPLEIFTNRRPAFPFGVYMMCTENRARAEIPHVQYGMVLTLIALVLALNAIAIFLRARVSKKLRG